MTSFYEIFSFLELPDINILDVGASAIDGYPIYHNLKAIDRAFIYGFEPSAEEYKQLQKNTSKKEVYFPYALGNGEVATLNICQAPGMTSLLKPDYNILDCFHGWSDWAKILTTETMLTHRLDDIKEIESVDFVKLDVQGSELSIIDHGTKIIGDSLVIHTEVNFVPFYENQPLFAEIDLALRKLGFVFHTFSALKKKAFKPLIVNNNIYEGINQVLWTDAVYVKNFTEFDRLSSEQLIKIAIILHDLYGSFDLVLLALKHLDKKENFDFSSLYLDYLCQKKSTMDKEKNE